jgi:hypothetical protein
MLAWFAPLAQDEIRRPNAAKHGSILPLVL